MRDGYFSVTLRAGFDQLEAVQREIEHVALGIARALFGVWAILGSLFGCLEAFVGNALRYFTARSGG